MILMILDNIFLGKEMISAHLVYRNVCKDHLLTKTVAVNTTLALPTDLQVNKKELRTYKNSIMVLDFESMCLVPRKEPVKVTLSTKIKVGKV